MLTKVDKHAYIQNENGQVNFKNSVGLKVDIPLFVIHGNHDDPSLDGTNVSSTLSPLDVLSTAGLLNYFGVHNFEKDSLKIKPEWLSL